MTSVTTQLPQPPAAKPLGLRLMIVAAAIIAVAAAPQAPVPPRLTVALEGLNDAIVTVGTPR